jgi:hypothetical protein
MKAQYSQRQTVNTVEPSRVNSVCLGVSGGGSLFHFIPVQGKNISFFGGFGQAEVFFFVTENITVGANYAYHFFHGKDSIANFPMDEVLISGAYHFKSSWNPHISFGLGYYGDPDGNHLGMVPGIGVMPKIAQNIYIKVRASAAFFNMGGQDFKIEVGLIFEVFQHKPIRK